MGLHILADDNYRHCNLNWADIWLLEYILPTDMKFYKTRVTNPSSKQNFIRIWSKLPACFILLTQTIHSPTKHNKGKWRKWAKSDYIIEAGLIHMGTKSLPVQWRPSGVPGVAVHSGAGDPQFESRGKPPFLDPSFPKRELGVQAWYLLLRDSSMG